MNRSWIVLTPVVVLGLSWTLATGCATDGVVEEPDSTVEGPTEASTLDATRDTRPPVDAPIDTSRPDTSQPDTSTDASVPDGDSGTLIPYPGDPFDPSAPKPGDPCPASVPLNEVVTRGCGKCGTQKAFCEAGRIVGQYGACSGEKTAIDACLPRAREVGISCGFCGTQTRLCNSISCQWDTGLCLNETPGGCVPTEVKHVDGVCPDPTHSRRQTCTATCTPGAPEPCGPQLPDVITATQTRGGIATGVFSLSPVTRTLPRLFTGNCPVTVSTTNTSYHDARIVNSGVAPINVTVNQVAAPGTTKPTMYLAAYVGRATEPITTAERQACSDFVRSSAPLTLTFTIPAGDSAIIHSTAVSANTTGKFKIEAITNFVGPEPVDTDLAMDPVTGQTVTAPVNIVNTQVIERLTNGICPRPLTTTKPGYRYIRVANPTATDRTVDLWLASGFNSILGVYPGPNPPISTLRGACLGELNDVCPPASGITGADSCLTGVTVPANGSVVVYASGSTTLYGTTTLSVRTTD